MRKINLSAIIILLFLVSQAGASFISISSNLTVKVQKDQLKIELMAENKGDESAFSAQAEFRIGGKTYLAKKLNELPVGGNYRTEQMVKLAPGKAGVYPLLMVMHYADANQYPFSALSAHTYVYQNEAISPVFGQLKSTAFMKEGEISLSLKNLSDKEVKVLTRLESPRELTVEGPVINLMIAPRSESSVSFKVKNFSALAGSTYQVFAVSETEDADLHYTSIAPASIRIKSSDGIMGLTQPVIMILLLVLVVFFIGAQFFKKK